MFKESQIKIFKLEDLTNRVLRIRSFYDKVGSVEVIAANDINTGEIFILKEIRHGRVASDDEN